MLKKLRSYQSDIINKVVNSNASTLIQIPTGGGKTLIAKEIAIKLINDFNKKILFIAPKIVLMEQTLDVFKGLKPQKVHGSNSKFDNNHHILISTLQTASRRNNLNPDVIIIDEVHFGYEKKMLNKIMEYNPTARIIGLSATPYDENGYPFKGFDLVINNYDIDYMIHNKYLVPIRSFILVNPDISNVNIIAGDYDLNQLSEAVSKNTIIMEIVKTSKPFIEKSIKTIVFAVDINHAELLKTAFLKEGIKAESLHSKSEEDDNEVISRFKKGYIKVLVSVLKLTTGFDVPETDVAIIARPTKSQNLYKQMVGRIARLAQNKKYGILLDCGNVIEDLGKPLDPIIPKDELDKKVQKLLCQICESDKIKLKKTDKNLFWECMDCGYKKEIENRNLYKCENCKRKYDYEGNFELINNSLYLNCECGYETKISTVTGNEKFIEVNSGSFLSKKNFEEEFNNDKFYKSESLSIDQICEFLVNKYIEKLKASSEGIKNFKNIKFQKCLYTSTEENKKRILNNYCEDILISLKNNDDVLLKSIFVKCKDIIDSKDLIFYFKTYIIFEKKENISDQDLLYQINYSKNFNLLKLLIETNYIPLDSGVLEISYNNEFYNIMKFIIEDNQIKKFDYWVGELIDFYDLNAIKMINLNFFDNISKFIDSIDFGKCFEIAYIFEVEVEDNELIVMFNILVNNLLILKNHFQEKNVDILLYDKKIDFNFLEFKEARKIIHEKKFKKFEEWFEYINTIQKEILIPFKPQEFYLIDWKGWDDFLGSENVLDKKTFDYARENNLNPYLYIENYLRNVTYGKFKKNNMLIVNGYLSFGDAKFFVHNLKLKSIQEWKYYCEGLIPNIDKIPDFIPTNPNKIYKNNGWAGFIDWLGL